MKHNRNNPHNFGFTIAAKKFYDKDGNFRSDWLGFSSITVFNKEEVKKIIKAIKHLAKLNGVSIVDDNLFDD